MRVSGSVLAYVDDQLCDTLSLVREDVAETLADWGVTATVGAVSSLTLTVTAHPLVPDGARIVDWAAEVRVNEARR